MNESAADWNKPDESKKNRNAGDNLSIDETRFGPVIVALILNAIQVVAGETSYNGRKGKLNNSWHLLETKLAVWWCLTSPMRSKKLNRSSRGCILSLV